MTSDEDFFLARLNAVPVLAILRGDDPAALARLADDCWDAGVELVEVSISRDPELEALATVCRRATARGRIAGAGTICNAEQVAAAARAGAAFAVAPGLDRAAIETARDLGLPYLPGVATPSEVQAALALGCRTLKLFPASILTPAWLRALAGPFPDVHFVAVGGVNAENASEFLAAGAIGLGIGSGLEPNGLRRLTARLRAHA